MTPQEKAEELFTTYRFALSIPNAPLGKYKDQIAKQCALIAVDEIIRIAPSYGIIEWTIDEDTKEYFELVKKEIEKL